jgi:K+-sensing histidine kinase KdpD
MIIIRNVSEFVKVEYAKTIEKVTDSMIAATSHDMRTPLNAITNMIELVQKKTTD